MSHSSRVHALLAVPAVCLALLMCSADVFGQELMGAYAFGSRNLECETPNQAGTNYTVVQQTSAAAVGYDAGRGYGFEAIYPENSPYGGRGGYGVYGPFDDSPNNRSKFGDDCPEQLYDSFIGAKNHQTECSEATEGSPDAVCADPEGIIFRVDVPNGQYQFVAAGGDADNVHAHRVLAEDGGSGPPVDVGDHVVLVENFDQAQQSIGVVTGDEPGEGVFWSVGFGGRAPPPGQDVMFVDQGKSPVLNVTQGYIRIHLLQGNSNTGTSERDPNGTDIVLLELWKVEGAGAPVPAMGFGVGMALVALFVGLGALILLRRRPATAS